MKTKAIIGTVIKSIFDVIEKIFTICGIAICFGGLLIMTVGLLIMFLPNLITSPKEGYAQMKYFVKKAIKI